MMESAINGNGPVPCKVGVFICHCGTNISKTVDVSHLAEKMAGHPNVEVSAHYKFMCSEPGQELIISEIKEHGLNRVVVAACSPLMHELTFRGTVERGGLNRYLFEMVNIREQVSWVTVDPKAATAKAHALIRGGIARSIFHEPLEMRRVPIGKQVMIIGGGIAGIEAALQIADAGYEVILVEKEESIGGHMAKFDKTFPTKEPGDEMIALAREKGIPLLTTNLPMFEACGRLYNNGLAGCSDYVD